MLERREQLGGLKSGHKQCKHSYRPRDNVGHSDLKSSTFFIALSFFKYLLNSQAQL
jgi:hypothetical protein